MGHVLIAKHSQDLKSKVENVDLTNVHQHKLLQQQVNAKNADPTQEQTAVKAPASKTHATPGSTSQWMADARIATSTSSQTKTRRGASKTLAILTRS